MNKLGISGERKLSKAMEYNAPSPNNNSKAIVNFTTNKVISITFIFDDISSTLMKISKGGCNMEWITPKESFCEHVVQSLDEFKDNDCSKFINEVLLGRIFVDKHVISNYLKDGIMRVLTSY